MVHRPRVTTIDEGRIAEDLTLPGEQAVLMVGAAEQLVHLGHMRPSVVTVQADEDLVGKRLQRPQQDGLERLSGDVDEPAITVAVSQRICVVGGHRLDQPSVYHGRLSAVNP